MIWPALFKQLLTDPMGALTSPAFYLQHTGELSIDGLGWVWQCNFFGHFVLSRLLESSLAASPVQGGGRVIWSSSLEASPKHYDPSDWQNKKTGHSYENTKYQIDIVANTLDIQNMKTNRRIRHLVSQPGVTSTNVASALIGPALDVLKVWCFYIVSHLGK